MKHAINIDINKSCIWGIAIELINERSELVIEDLVGRVDSLNTSSSIWTVLSQFTWAAPNLSQTNQRKFPGSIVVQNLDHSTKLETFIAKNSRAFFFYEK